MQNTPIHTRPPSPRDELLQTKLIEDIAAQSTRMDDLARQLITLELAIPGIYVAALKLAEASQITLGADSWLRLTFICWMLALGLALFSLIPHRYEVDHDRLAADDEDGSGPLSIEGYFRHSARFKRRLLIPSGGLLFVGIGLAAFAAL
ncbi:MAG: hypothetical protein J7D61_15375 [Marichromatium sp.]|nr:hypothetical protein [Marichromatium sp.]